MPRYVRCRICNESVEWSQKDDMEVEEAFSEKTGKTIRKYYHKGDCWKKRLKEKEFIKQEMKEKDELNEVIKQIHGIKYDLSTRFWEMLQDLRNGTNRFQKFWKKKYKRGVPYHVIKEAYLMSRHDIEWARLNVGFKTTEAETRYCLKIVGGKVNDAYNKIKRTEQSEEVAKATEKKQLEQMSEDREVKWKKKESEFDISHILGDD